MRVREASSDINPYRSPDVGQGDSEVTESSRRSKLEELGSVIVTWEKLRLLYNAIGFIPTLLIALVVRAHPFELVVCVFVANLCFCLGPLVDGYLTWFGFRQRAVTVILFVLGTLLMLLLAIVYGLSVVYTPF